MGIRQQFRDANRAWYDEPPGLFRPFMRWRQPWTVAPGEVPSPQKLQHLKKSSVVEVPTTVALIWLAWSQLGDLGVFLWVWTAFAVGIAGHRIWVAWFRTYP